MPLTRSHIDDKTLFVIEVNTIVKAVNESDITMPGTVIKKKQEFTVKIEAKMNKVGGEIVVTVTPNRGWKLPQRVTTKHISIKNKGGQSLKHRVFFSLQGKAKLSGIGIGDYVLYMA